MPELDTERTHHLGGKAFFLFLGTRIFWFFGIAAAIFAYWWFVSGWVPFRYLPYFDYSVRLFWLLLAAYVMFGVLRAFLEYHSHRYRFEEEFFHVFRGYINQEEVNVVYQQIQTVTVKRPLLARAVGVAHLYIMMGSGDGESEHLLGLDVKKARLVQRELVARSRKSHETPHRPKYRPVPFEDIDDEA